jgi:hypothetical protein
MDTNDQKYRTKGQRLKILAIGLPASILGFGVLMWIWIYLGDAWFLTLVLGMMALGSLLEFFGKAHRN